MARPKKYPTKVMRIRTSDIETIRKMAKIKKLTIPDYLNWRLKK